VLIGQYGVDIGDMQSDTFKTAKIMNGDAAPLYKFCGMLSCSISLGSLMSCAAAYTFSVIDVSIYAGTPLGNVL